MNVLLSRQEAKSSYSCCIVLTQRMCTSGTWLEVHPEFCKNYLKPYKNKWYSLVFQSGRSQNPLFAWLQHISSNFRHWSRYTETWRGCSRDDRKVRQFSTHPSSFETCWTQLLAKLLSCHHWRKSANHKSFVVSSRVELRAAWKICSFPVVFIYQVRNRGVKKPYNSKYFKYIILGSFQTVIWFNFSSIELNIDFFLTDWPLDLLITKKKNRPCWFFLSPLISIDLSELTRDWKTRKWRWG